MIKVFKQITDPNYNLPRLLAGVPGAISVSRPEKNVFKHNRFL